MRRFRFATVAVTGLGSFVAVAVGVTLYFSGITGVRSTQELIAAQAESQLDALEQRIEAHLAPVEAQAAAIAAALAERRIDPVRTGELDAFMLGALAATPHVLTLGIVEPSGRMRGWSREEPGMNHDWSKRDDVMAWLDEGMQRSAGGWRAPLWTPVKQIPALLYDMPLRRDGRFVGMLGQMVSIAHLSEVLAEFRAEHGVTPFILYGRDAVLAHPALARADAPRGPGLLANVRELGDPVIAALLADRGWEPLSLHRLKRARGGHVKVERDPYMYLLRDIKGYGEQTWTLGVYLDPVAGGQRAQMLTAVVSLAAGVVILMLAVLTARFAGRRLARTVEALAKAARAVREERLDEVPRLPPSAIAEFHEAGRSFEQMVSALRERSIMRATLGQFMPEQVARSVIAAGGKLEPVEAKATVLMCDIEGFAALTDSLGPHGAFEFLNAYFERVVAIVERHGGVITQFQGDAILAVFNLPLPDRDHAANALRAALEIVADCDAQPFAGVRARNRIGISTGRVVAGAVGSSGRLSYTVHGNAVNLAARIEAANKDYGTRILLSAKTAERCPGFALRKVAEATIRGYTEPVALFTPGAVIRST